jgi:hypothetical protein
METCFNRHIKHMNKGHITGGAYRISHVCCALPRILECFLKNHSKISRIDVSSYMKEQNEERCNADTAFHNIVCSFLVTTKTCFTKTFPVLIFLEIRFFTHPQTNLSFYFMLDCELRYSSLAIYPI